MKRKELGWALLAMSCVITSAPTRAAATLAVDDVPINVDLSGFIRADYGNGDRYSKSDGEDRLGISKSFLVVTASTEDIQGILDFGASAFTDSDVNPGNNGNVGIKDAFIIIGAGKKTGFTFSAGAQPLLYGLKPNGYPGDSSLTPNIDYGASGGFAVSQQAGPSLIGNYKFTPDLSVRFGAFDLAESNARNGFTTATNGSKLKDNLFLLLRGSNLGDTGIYATAGAERIYVGAAGALLGAAEEGPVIDHSKTIYSAGVGFKRSIFDVSLEYIHLDAAIVNTRDDERYLRAAVSVQPVEQWTAYADYSNGHELGASTYRIGGNYQFRRHLAVTLEYSKDHYKLNNLVYAGGYDPLLGTPALYGTVPPGNVQSVDARLTFTY